MQVASKKILKRIKKCRPSKASITGEFDLSLGGGSMGHLEMKDRGQIKALDLGLGGAGVLALATCGSHEFGYNGVSWLLNTLVIWWLGGGLWFVGWGDPWLGYGYLVLHYFYMAVWHVQGAPPPLEAGATILVLNAFGIGCLASCLKITLK